ncbi:acyltransferase [Mariniblastus sp.]|nr:acyltransferase [Mariniblastus sp.]
MIQTNPLVRVFDFMIGMTCGFVYLNRRARNQNVSKIEVSSDQRSKLIPALIHLATISGAITYFLLAHKGFQPLGKFYIPSLAVGNVWMSVCSAAPAFAITIFAYAWKPSWVSKFFGSRVMVYLGEISFAFYLIHQAILITLKRQVLSDSPNAMGWLVVSGLFLSLAAAMLLYHLVDLPSRAGMIRMFSCVTSRGEVPAQSRLSRYGSWLTEYGRALWRLCLSPKLLVLVGLLITGYLFADAGLFDFRDTRLIERVIDQTADEFKGVQFDQDAVLEGLEIQHQPDGSYQIQIVWDLKKGRRPNRFLHICDSSGKILRHGGANRSVFARATENGIVLDRVTVSKAELESAAMLAIGFHGPERKSARIVNSSPGQPTHRLPILRLDP